MHSSLLLVVQQLCAFAPPQPGAWLPAQAPQTVLMSPVRAVRVGDPVMAEDKVPSFVQTEMRSAAMKLHTRDQAPREGEQPAQRPVQTWQPGRADYLQFLVDSREVYSALEDIVTNTPDLQSLANSGLERSEGLAKDIAWFESEGMPAPPVAAPGKDYAVLLREMITADEQEKFICHFYNFYFAHTAGGRMIGKRMADMLLDGRTLDFYKWDADPKEELLPTLRSKIDALVAGWTREQKDACLAETANSFRTGGSLLSHLKEPEAATK